MSLLTLTSAEEAVRHCVPSLIVVLQLFANNLFKLLSLLRSLLEINSSPLAVSQTALKQSRRPTETRTSSILSPELQTNLQITFPPVVGRNYC